MKTILKNLSLVIPVVCLLLTSCESDDPEPLSPTIDNVEIGLGNNEIGIIGRDFHFNAEILAGDKIDLVQIKIEPKNGENYDGPWSFEKKWDKYKGVKNATVHEHFNIPEDAVEGTYDFIIVVADENGTTLEEVRTINIYLEENLEVDPFLAIFTLFRNMKPVYLNGEFSSTQDNPNIIKKGDSIMSQATISGVKGDGIMYLLLIKKSLNHRPESVEQIDFSKVVVADVYEHESKEEIYEFSNFHTEPEPVFKIVRVPPQFTIGAEEDLNVPASSISQEKAWENGEYYFGVVYKNTTYNMGYFKYIDLQLNGF